MDIRGRRLKKQNESTTRFTSSIGFDGAISQDVVRVNEAHMLALAESGEARKSTAAECLTFLQSVPTKVDPSAMAEDYHQLLEQMAVDSLGIDVAGYLNLGKSRNDQVATALRMRLKRVVLKVIRNTTDLQDSVLGVAKRQGTAVMPGYTHLQHAQPITLGHHMFAYFDSLQRDVCRLFDLYRRADSSPMGSAALAGTTVAIDRADVASLLGFDRVTGNAMDAVSSRDIELEAMGCFAILMSSLSRIAEELVLWSSREFSFVEIPDGYAATSSIMPQKKNPIVAEVVRAKAGSVLGAFTAALVIVKGLPYSYNLDLQEATPHLWRAAEDVSSSVAILASMTAGVRFNEEAMALALEGDYSTATALANYLVEECDISFRQAHSIVGGLVRVAASEGLTLEAAAGRKLRGMLKEETQRDIPISKSTIDSVLSVRSSLNGIETPGGANPQFIANDLGVRVRTVKGTRARLRTLDSGLRRSEMNLERRVKAFVREVKG